MTTRTDRDEVIDLLRRIDMTMMVTRAPSGPLDCRPMQVAECDVEQGGAIWFVTSVETRKVKEIHDDPRVLLVSQQDGLYLAVWGNAEIVDDRKKATALWKDAYRAWFPNGLNDPDLRLVRVVPHSAEYWDNTGAGRGRYLFDATRSAAPGQPAAVAAETRHGRTNL